MFGYIPSKANSQADVILKKTTISLPRVFIVLTCRPLTTGCTVCFNFAVSFDSELDNVDLIIHIALTNELTLVYIVQK